MTANHKLSELFDKKFDRHLNEINENISGIFLFGVFTGIIISYTGFIGYFLGFTSGMITSHKYGYITTTITKKIMAIIDNVTNQVNKQINKKEL